jgi:hypothetical protein
VEQHETQKQRLFQRRLEGGGNAAIVAPGRFSNLSDIITINTPKKSE